MQKALEKYNEALPLRRVVGDRIGEAMTLNNIGVIHNALGEAQKEFKTGLDEGQKASGDDGHHENNSGEHDTK